MRFVKKSKFSLQVFNGEGGQALHPDNGFTGSTRPELVLSAEEGEMVIKFRTDSLQNAKGFSAVFSADCPPLVPGEGNCIDIYINQGIKEIAWTSINQMNNGNTVGI